MNAQTRTLATYPLVPCDKLGCGTLVEPHVGRCTCCRQKHGLLTKYRPGIPPWGLGAIWDAEHVEDAHRGRPHRSPRPRTLAVQGLRDESRRDARPRAGGARSPLLQWSPR